jgi:hypothetical protein
MSIIQNNLKAVVFSSSQEITASHGPIIKLQALGAANGASVVERLEFGNTFVSGGTEFKASHFLSESIQIPAGSVIDGPIGRVKSKTNGWIAYYIGSVTDPNDTP